MLSKREAEQAISDSGIKSWVLKKLAGREPGEWIEPTLVNGWDNDSSTYNLAYRVDADGNVVFRGRITGGTTSNGTRIFTLDEEYRPDNDVYFAVVSGDYARVRVNPDGEATIFGCGDSIGFDGVFFTP